MTEVLEPPRRLKRLFVGRPMRTGQLEETLLPKTLALPIFASDPLSSVAYATESALVVLVAVSAASAHLVFPISIAIAALLAVVVVSYMQTVHAYETSGGAYIVARENLGTVPSLVGAAALLTDYVLTVAVSISAGIFAVTSFAPSLAGHKVALSLGCLLLIVLVNLRGVRESGLAFALPTYLFVTAVGVLVVAGVIELATGHAHRAVVPHALPVGTGAITLFVLLRAFSSGSTALTGVEAIANGVNAFRRPHGKNAAQTLAILGSIAIFLFLGVSYLAVHLHARPSSTASVVSQIARAVFPAGSAASFMYYAVQGLTLLVLILAANTSFQGFPRLSALLARDRFAPRQFTNLGDRLVFSNGMVVLATVAGLLLWIYGANTNNLIHLYVIGVFTAFTLSQAGMVHYWFTRADAALEGEGARERRRRDGDRGRRARRRLHEVRRGRVARDRRDPGARRRHARRAAALRAARAAVARGCRGGRRSAAGAQHDAARRRADRRGGRERAADRARDLERRACARCTCRHAEPTRAFAPRWFKLAGEPLEVARSVARRDRGGARAGLAATAQRVGLRHGRRARALRQPLAPRAGAAPARARAQAPPALRARRRRRRRAGRAGERRGRALARSSRACSSPASTRPRCAR